MKQQTYRIIQRPKGRRRQWMTTFVMFYNAASKAEALRYYTNEIAQTDSLKRDYYSPAVSAAEFGKVMFL